MGKFFKTDRKIRLGIWGLGRGRAFQKLCADLNIEVVAGCDFNESMRDTFHKMCPDAFVTDNEDEFLAYHMDAVLVATFFMNHARDSIKALKAGKHVMSEVTSFFTPAEGVALVEAVEESGKFYCLAENYADHFVKQLWQEGVFGELSYAEVDYVHDCRALSYSTLYGDPLHPGNQAHSWRSWLNFHYYCTHSLGAAMEMTGRRPVKVMAPPSHKNLPGFLPGSEMGCMEPSFVIMDNGATVRNLMGATTADSRVRRFWGTRAFVDASGNKPVVALGQCGHGPRVTLEPPKDEFSEYTAHASHNGGDFWVLYSFADAILNGAGHPWNIYSACDVTLTGIMAVKSQYNGGIPVDVPDFRDKAVREQYRDDSFAQQHFDPKALFPEDQNPAETKKFSVIMTELDHAWECAGAPLVISALDGMKLFKYLADDASREIVQNQVKKLLFNIPGLTETFRNARALAEKYPDSLAGQALQSFIDSAYPEKMADTTALGNELRRWLSCAGLPPYRQLKMTMDEAGIKAAKTPAVPAGFTLRTIRDGEEAAYVELMQSAGFTSWSMAHAERCKANMLDGGIYFIVEDATGRLAATAMANKYREGREEDGGELGWVGVNPDFRGCHFATIVCTAVLEHYARAGYTKSYLTTDDWRVPAIITYLKSGWKPVIKDEEMSRRWDRLAKKINIKINVDVDKDEA